MPKTVAVDLKNALYAKTHFREIRPRIAPGCALILSQRADQSTHKRTKADRQIPYTCKICDKVFKRRGHLDTHVRLHSGERPYLCKECGKGFRSQDSLKSHTVVHSDEKTFRCDQCKKTFKTSHQMRKHLRLTKIAMAKNEPNGHRPVKCKLCDHQIMTKQERREHMRFHKKDNPYRCSSCKKSFGDLKDLGDHYKSCDKKSKPYRCSGCKESFGNLKELGDHYKTCDRSKCRPRGRARARAKAKAKAGIRGRRVRPTKNPEGPVAQFACHRCCKRFKTISGLGLHFITHTDSDHFRCTTCREEFEGVLDYQKHECFQETAERIKPKLIVKFQTYVLDPRLAESDGEQVNTEEVDSCTTQVTDYHQEGFSEHTEDVQDEQEAQSSNMQDVGHGNI